MAKLILYLISILALATSQKSYSQNNHIPKWSYHGDMRPNLCDKHLGIHPDTKDLYFELQPYLHLLPKMSLMNIPACMECPKCHGMSMRGSDSLVIQCQSCQKFSNRKDWIYCEGPCLNAGYFQKQNRLFLPFFLSYLQYCSENQDCKCYWPENGGLAAGINQLGGGIGGFLRGRGDLLPIDFSPYWNSKTDIDKSLAVYCFFYSHYYKLCLELIRHVYDSAIDSKKAVPCLNKIYSSLESFREDFFLLYNNCLTQHPHPKIHYELGLLLWHSGEISASLEQIQLLITLALSDPFKNKNILTSEVYQQEGEAYASLGIYDKAIESLSQAIEKDPLNREAYFQRASAYFEIGNFDNALDDYLASKKRENIVEKLRAPSDFAQALLSGLKNGSQESVSEFFPSLLYSAYGLSKGLWAIAQDPINQTINFTNACHETAELTVQFCKNLDWEKLEGYSVEIRHLCEKYHQLSNIEKGQLIGYAIGKYGVDILAPCTTMRGIATFKKLKEANQLCNLEALTVSNSNKIIRTKAEIHALERSNAFKTVPYNFDSHNKHVLGHNDFTLGKSIWEHPDPEMLLKKHACTGNPRRFDGTPGVPGYQEDVDFGVHIGRWVSEDRTMSAPTTKGRIHYAKKGAHIVPISPETIIYK